MNTACSFVIAAGTGCRFLTGKRQEFPKSPGMLHDPQHGAMRAMPPEVASAPFADAARKIDFAGDPLADPAPVFGLRHLTHELVPGRARKAVVSALEFEIGGADPRAKETDSREPTPLRAAAADAALPRAPIPNEPPASSNVLR